MTTTRDLLAAADLLIATSWEMTPEEFEERLAAFTAESTDKLAAIKAVLRAYEGKQEAHKQEARIYTEAARLAGKRADRLTELAGMLVRAAEEVGEPLAGAKFVANGGKVPLVYAEGFNPADLPLEYQRVSIEADADRLRAAIEAGAEIPGVTLGARGSRLKWTP